jgi:DNA-binding GntR family transcriptional regulator
MPAFKFKIKANSATSVTQQVADQIREAIEGGRLKAGDRLPSEMEIADQLGMSRGVGKKAYRKLKDLGLFYNSGTGRVVLEKRASKKGSAPAKKSAPASAKSRTASRSASKAPAAQGSKKRAPARKR